MSKKEVEVQFNEEQLINLYGIQFAIAYADGDLDKDELKKIFEVMEYSEFSDEGKTKVQSYFLVPPRVDDILLEMKNEISEIKYTAYMNAIEVAISNDDVSESQENELNKIKEVFGITEVQAKKMREFAVKAKQIAERGIDDKYAADALKSGVAGLGAVGVPVAAVYFSRSEFGLSAADMPNLATVDLAGARKLENVTFSDTQLTSLDLTGLTLKTVMINGSPISDFKMDEGQKLVVFLTYGGEIETFPHPPVSADWLDGSEQAPRKEVVVLEDGRKQITIASTSALDERTIGFDGVYDAETNTITWGADVSMEDILTQNIPFKWNIGPLTILSGTYVLEGKIEKEPEPEVDPVAVHTVNFYDCDGNLVGQDWPSDGENAKGPAGYTYGSTELTNITYSKDIKPTSCFSGEFAIPNTGVR